MAVMEIDGYLFSDDFERFYTILSSMMPVFYMSSKTFGKLRKGDARYFGLERWGLKERFGREKVLFLDPSMIVNPDVYETNLIAPSSFDYHLPDMREMTFVNIRNLLDGIVLSCREKKRDIERCLGSSRMKRLIEEESSGNGPGM